MNQHERQPDVATGRLETSQPRRRALAAFLRSMSAGDADWFLDFRTDRPVAATGGAPVARHRTTARPAIRLGQRSA